MKSLIQFPQEQSDLDLHCMPTPVCLIALGYCGKLTSGSSFVKTIGSLSFLSFGLLFGTTIE